MAANNPLNIFVSKNSVLSISYDLDAVKPTTLDQQLAPSYLNIGLTSDAGEAMEKSVTTETINAHQLLNARVIITEGTITIGVEGIEANDVTQELYWAVEKSTTEAVEIDPGSAKYVSFVYDTYDTDEGYEKHERFYGVALVTPNGAINNERGAASMYPLLFTVQGKLGRTHVATVSGS